MKQQKQYVNRLIFTYVLILLTAKIGIASNCPIIFLHGHESNPTDTTGWKNTWRNPHSAMKKILNSQYREYSTGDPLECNENSSLTSTGGETRKVYSFSYYCHDGDSGAIGSNGALRCSKVKDAISGRWYPREEVPPENAIDLYAGVVNNNSWAQKLAHFINKVRAATGASQVDIVAHSMGGLVARAAMKYYGCAGKVRKLLMIGTPNHPYQHSFGEWIYDMITNDKPWQKYGEDLEMDVDMATGGYGINFETSDPTSDAPWCDHLGYENQGVMIATITGNRGYPGLPENDKIVAVSQVKMGNSADFEPTIFASHSYQGDGLEEVSEVTCTYTEEFIKKWIIDDSVNHNGAQLTGAGDVFLWPLPWDSFEVRLHASVDDYNKALVLQSVICDLYSGEELMAKAFPIYTYQKSTIDEPFGDPILSTSNLNFDTGFYRCKNFIYDMDHAVATHEANFEIKNLGLPARIEVIEPSNGDIYTVQGAWDKFAVQFKANFQWANLNIYFSPHEAGPLTPVWTATNYKGDGETKTIQFAMPQVNSPYCRVSVKAKLDNFTDKECISDYFTIRLVAPEDLHCFSVDESKVGLDWLGGSLTGFEVQRRLKNTSTWVVVDQGYWGPGSKSFYDTDVMRDTVYYYRVRSYGVFQGQTYYSEDFCTPISVTTPKLNAPYHELRVHSPASDRIMVEFRDMSIHETSFEVWRKSPVNNEVWHIVHEPGPAIGYHGMTIM